MILQKIYNTKKDGYINIAAVSDIHLGHSRVRTPEILSSLYKLFPDNDETASLDYIFITGDLFDKGLPLNFDFLREMIIWIHWLISKCKKYDIALRVLEGTPSHDRMQSKLIGIINEVAGSNIDYFYATKLMIEHDKKRNITIMYLPDEWTSPMSLAYLEAKSLLAKEGLEKVDFALTHGTFEHQLPPHIKIDKHISKDWSSLVLFYIFNGHIHKFSLYLNIVSPSSIERLAHNEEEPKGHVRALIDINKNKKTINFIENKEAKTFKTIDVKKLSFDEATNRITETVKDFRKGSFTRIESDNLTDIKLLIVWAKDHFPDFIWSVKPYKEPKSDNQETDYSTKKINRKAISIDLSKETLLKISSERLLTQEVDEVVRNRILNVIKEAEKECTI